ncbi:hypothetical protein PSECIP111951_01169 [Pseudoalteromonas holothuriae]|uniref:Uncharacterized protein n=1 Tax=Pseudoalteromonas holothuriae TaxID=2963714 RepID=A0ABM9GFW1_9GAMM|nr:hypothetical protein PSECIP111951_01169 [Pseudoalteromonas sp. CIP111951]
MINQYDNGLSILRNPEPILVILNLFQDLTNLNDDVAGYEDPDLRQNDKVQHVLSVVC